MSNLKYVRKETREIIEAILNSPATADITKEIIINGLEKDCIDAVYYVSQAAEVLRLVADDILGKYKRQ